MALLHSVCLLVRLSQLATKVRVFSWSLGLLVSSVSSVANRFDNNDKQKALSLNKIFRICLLVFCLFVCSQQWSASSHWSLGSTQSGVRYIFTL